MRAGKRVEWQGHEGRRLYRRASGRAGRSIDGYGTPAELFGRVALWRRGAGLSVFPCFVGDSDQRLVRVAPPIAELETDQWLVSHHEERHEPAVHAVADRIAALMKRHGPLFRGETPLH